VERREGEADDRRAGRCGHRALFDPRNDGRFRGRRGTDPRNGSGRPATARLPSVQIRHGDRWILVPHAWQSLDAPIHFEDPSLFYHGNGVVPRVEERTVGRIAGATIIRFTFPTLHPMKFPETNLAVGRLYRNRGAPGAPVVIISPAGRTRRSGRSSTCNVRRSCVPASRWRSSRTLCTSSGPSRGLQRRAGGLGRRVLTVEAFRQGVIDMIGAANWLRAKGTGRSASSDTHWAATLPGSWWRCATTGPLWSWRGGRLAGLADPGHASWAEHP